MDKPVVESEQSDSKQSRAGADGLTVDLPSKTIQASAEKVTSPSSPGKRGGNFDPEYFDKERTVKEMKDSFAIMRGEYNQANLGLMIALKKVLLILTLACREQY